MSLPDDHATKALLRKHVQAMAWRGGRSRGEIIGRKERRKAIVPSGEEAVKSIFIMFRV